MKPSIVTKAIVLSRTDYQEADRILTVLTPDQGKLRVIAKGVRRAKSKLAGGIELFSVNDLTILTSTRELKTLISSRLDKHFPHILTDISRTMLGYALLKHIHTVTEDEPEPAYYNVLTAALEGLNNMDIAPGALELWFHMQLLKIGGHAPNLTVDTELADLQADQTYLFDFEHMAFRQQNGGPYSANHIKLLRLAHGSSAPGVFAKVQDTSGYMEACLSLAKNISRHNV